METALVRPEWLFEVANRAQVLALTPLPIRTVEDFRLVLEAPQPTSTAEEQLLRRFFEVYSSAVSKRQPPIPEDHLPNDGHSPRETRLNNAITLAAYLLRTQCEQHWTLNSLARRVGLNRTDLETEFSARFGLSVHTYLANCRVNSAKILLRAKHWRVLEVARSVGYKTKAPLYQWFRRRVGLTPEEYRNRWHHVPINSQLIKLLNLNQHCQI